MWCDEFYTRCRGVIPVVDLRSIFVSEPKVRSGYFSLAHRVVLGVHYHLCDFNFLVTRWVVTGTRVYPR